MSAWSKWFGILEAPPCDGAAVYRVRVEINEKPIAIRRIGEIDREGILFFGETSNLKQRIYQLQRTFETGAYGHPEIALYKKVRRRLNKRLGYTGLQYSYQMAGNGSKAHILEARYIRNYFRKFCEPPPFNSSIPRKS